MRPLVYARLYYRGSVDRLTTVVNIFLSQNLNNTKLFQNDIVQGWNYKFLFSYNFKYTKYKSQHDRYYLYNSGCITSVNNPNTLRLQCFVNPGNPLFKLKRCYAVFTQCFALGSVNHCYMVYLSRLSNYQ